MQFEPYGIQRLTPYIDQPDILPLWTIRLEADAKELPVLLSNGDLVQQGKLPNGRHFVVWKVRLTMLCLAVCVTCSQLCLLYHS